MTDSSAGNGQSDHTDVLWQRPVEGVPSLRDALESVAPSHTVRLVVQRLRLMERGADVGSHLVVCAVLNAGGNLVPMSLTSTLARKPEEAAAVEAAFAHIEAALDGDGALGRDTTEVVMDADGAEEVRIGFGVEVAPSEVDQEPQHPAVHDGDYHATHRAPDLEDLRDRLHEASRPMMLRWWDRLRAALPARG